MVSLASKRVVDGLSPESPVHGAVLAPNSHTAVSNELRLRNNLSSKDLEDLYRVGAGKSLPPKSKAMTPIQQDGGTVGRVQGPQPAAIPEDKEVDLKLPGKVLKKLSKLTNWGRGQSGGSKPSSNGGGQASEVQKTAGSEESIGSPRPPVPYRPAAASMDMRVSTEIRRPSTAARLSLDLPGASKCAKRTMPEMPDDAMGPMKKSTSTESLSNLYSNFLSILADSPAVGDNAAPDTQGVPRQGQASTHRASGRNSTGSYRSSKGASPRTSDVDSPRRTQRRTPFSRSDQNGSEALPWDEASRAPPAAQPKPEVPAKQQAQSLVNPAPPAGMPLAQPQHTPQSRLTATHARPSEELRSSEEELFYRLSRARQTMDFVRRQYERFGTLDRAELNIFEALRLLNTMTEYEAVLLGDDTDVQMTLLEHAFQTAEKLRRDCPDDDWLHLVGLVHGLGKLLAHEDFGAEPQWSVVGESFPVGCRFQETINHHQLFYANPDRRNRQHNSVNGIYRQGCGLHEVNFSWSGAEYLYLILYLNGTRFPPEALFCIRYQKFDSLFRGGYKNILAYEDIHWMPKLQKLREASIWVPDEAILQRIHDESQNKEMCDYYQSLVEKYIGTRQLYW